MMTMKASKVNEPVTAAAKTARPDSLETVKAFRQELDENAKRAEVIKKYGDDFEKNDELDANIKELLLERKMLKARYQGSAAEAKQLMKRLQEEAARIQVKSSEIKGAIKYIEDKIVARDHELNIK